MHRALLKEAIAEFIDDLIFGNKTASLKINILAASGRGIHQCQHLKQYQLMIIV